jgi:D-alanine-D-alanine ligase
MLSYADCAALKISVIAGGRSPEGKGSRLSGATARDALVELGANAVLVDLNSPSLVEEVSRTDVAFVAGHGWEGEDGKLQGLLEILGIPYTGSGVLASAICMYKPTFKTLMEARGLPTPKWSSIHLDSADYELSGLIEQLGGAVFVKPASGGYSFGAGVARNIEEIRAIIRVAPAYSEQPYVAEQYVTGIEVTVGVLCEEGSTKVLPPLMTQSFTEFYDERAKSDPNLRNYVCPAPLSAATIKLLQDQALKVFEVSMCHGFGRVDFMVHNDGLTVLEMNTVPGLSRDSNLATMAYAADIEYGELIRIMLASAFNRPTYIP